MDPVGGSSGEEEDPRRRIQGGGSKGEDPRGRIQEEGLEGGARGKIPGPM